MIGKGGEKVMFYLEVEAASGEAGVVAAIVGRVADLGDGPVTL